jgi:hypothetical protein
MCSRFIAVIFQRTTRGRRLEFLNLRPPAFLSKTFKAIAKKKVTQKQKEWRDDLCGKPKERFMNSILPGTIEEPGLDTDQVGTLEAPSGGAWLALEAVRLNLYWLDRRGPPSPYGLRA